MVFLGYEQTSTVKRKCFWKETNKSQKDEKKRKSRNGIANSFSVAGGSITIQRTNIIQKNGIDMSE
jgi:hypothetical protein